MDKTYDEIQAINSLVQSLSQQLVDSNEHIVTLQNIAKGLVNKNQFQELSKEVIQSELVSDGIGEDIDEEMIIRALENQRLELVMDLQKQDFMTEKLVDLVDQNEDIVATVKEYLETRDSIWKEEDEHATRSFNSYTTNILGATEEKLEACTIELKNSTKKVVDLLKVVEEKSESNYKVLESDEYRNEVSVLIEVLNKVLSDGETIKGLTV